MRVVMGLARALGSKDGHHQWMQREKFGGFRMVMVAGMWAVDAYHGGVVGERLYFPLFVLFSVVTVC
jgi:hypothetical protein